MSLNSLQVSASEIKTPSVEAKGAILMDFVSGRVLYEKDSKMPMPMASTTKIMTAVIALEERQNLDEIVTVTRLAAGTPPVKMHLTPGEKISLRSLLYALMLQSSNDAAVAIAEHIGGSVEIFCEMMTDRALELGAKDTVFETPNGLDSDNHASTAYDLAVIARHALANPEFVSIINTQNITVKSDRNTYNIMNRNRLLHEYDGALGVKTGYTGGAGHCFVGAAKRGDLQLISVVLASGWGDKGKQQKWIDTKRLLNHGFDNYEIIDIAIEGGKAGSADILRSKTDALELYYQKGLALPVNAYEQGATAISLELTEGLKAPVLVGQQLGKAIVTINGEKVAEIPLICNEEAERFDMKVCLESALNRFLGLTSKAKPSIILPEGFYSE